MQKDMRYYINLIESAQTLELNSTVNEAPYLDNKHIPVDIDQIIGTEFDGLEQIYAPIIDPIRVQKLTKGAIPVVKLNDGNYYKFSTKDDKIVYIQQVDVPVARLKHLSPVKKMSFEEFYKSAGGELDFD